MYIHIDLNKFYVNCHRVFEPQWIGKPVIVLSNNDGCAIAISKEAKALGIKMAAPEYQIRHLVEQHGIKEYSSNYALYGDMSNRFVATLYRFFSEIEIYSIDEVFVDIKGYKIRDLKEFGTKLVKTVFKHIGLPCCVGIAPTKTLAKLGTHFAKKYAGYKSVCVIDTEEKRLKALRLTGIEEVWGIGRRYAKFLLKSGIGTAYEFTRKDKAWVRQNMTVVGERTWMELNGEPCIGMEIEEAQKKHIFTSRSFSHNITTLEELKEPVATYAALCAEKLRKQKGCASALMVFIHTNNFRKDIPQYSRQGVVSLPVPTNSTLEITKYALKALENIYKEGFRIKKAGVIVMDIIPENSIQSHLFYQLDIRKHREIARIMDRYNGGFLNHKIGLGIQGREQKWKLKREKLSPCYTTKRKDFLKINCKE